MKITKRKIAIDIAIPGSLGLQVKNKMIRTYIIGLVGRYAAMFRVNNILIYRDNEYDALLRNQAYIEDILRYMAIPQYLRRIIMPKKRIFRYIGVLPPLRTPNHPKFKPTSRLKRGEYREGIITNYKENRYEVNIGTNKPVYLPLTEKQHKISERLILRIKSTKGNNIMVEIVDKSEIPFYWCYLVESQRLTLKKLLSQRRLKYDIIIGTSRWGENIIDLKNVIKRDLENKKSMLIVFGGSSAGIYDILNVKKGSKIDFFDYIINFIPNQGTKTVRTEEAIGGTLSIINMLSP